MPALFRYIKIKLLIPFLFSLGGFLLLPTVNVFAQELPAVSVETINGKKYYIHKVEQGHTLYAISKKYMVEIEHILAENPDIKEGLKIDQLLKIPLLKQNKNIEKLPVPQIKAGAILHTVEQGQTLYSLSRTYNIDLAALVDANPGIENGVRVGQSINIPVNQVKNVTPVAVNQAKEDGLLRHTIQKGETLYSLAKHYQVLADSISKVNNGLPGGLRLGEVIIIPKRDVSKSKIPIKSVLASRADSIAKYIKTKFNSESSNDPEAGLIDFDGFNVALFLPLYLDDNADLIANRKEFEKEGIFPKSNIALSFYEGFLFALDSLKEQGISVKLFVFDTGNDTATIREIVAEKPIKEMDLIVGPLYANGFNFLSEYALKHKIHIVSPFSSQSSIIKNNPSTSKPSSSSVTKIQQTIGYIADKHNKDNVLLINSGSEKDKESNQACSNSFSLLLDGVKYKEINYLTSRLEGVRSNLISSQNNLIVVPSNDQAFVTELTTNLNSWAKEYKITLVGLDSWVDYDNLDLNYLQNLHTHFGTSSYVDFEKQEIKDFLSKYRAKNFIDPDFYAFQGFDIAYYYLSGMGFHGTDFSKILSKKHSGLQTNFNFSKLNAHSGFENNGVIILKYQDFKLVNCN